MTKYFLFYDLETSGLNKSFDQILQFAAIKTDLELNVIDEYEYLVKLSPDTLIHPKALMVHGLGPEKCKNGIDEFSAVCKIHSLLNTPNTISLGYNTLKFDDEFLRFAFFKHLLAPYTHQFANNCHRADIYPLLTLYKIFSPDIIKWPDSMKLEDINQLNSLHDGNAHDAMNDVKATLELARIMAKNTTMWQFSLEYFNKQIDLQRTNKILSKEKHAMLISTSCGKENNYNQSVVYLGRHKHYKNQSIWLKLDPQINLLSLDELERFIVRKKDGEPNFILPFKRMQQEKPEILSWCTDKNLKVIADHYTQKTLPPFPCDINASLYQIKFPTANEAKQQIEFINSSWENKLNMLNQLSQHTKVLAERIIWRHHPDRITKKSAILEKYISNLQNSISHIDHTNQPFITKKEVLNQIQTMPPHKLLDEYRDWINNYYAI